MDDNFVNKDDERLIKTLIKHKPTFNEEVLSFYLSYTGCKVNEKSCLRLISLALQKSVDELIDKTFRLQSEKKKYSNKKEEKETPEKEKELNYEALVEALEETCKIYENEEEMHKNFNVFLE